MLAEITALLEEYTELNVIARAELDERLSKFIQIWLALYYLRDFHSATRRQSLLKLMESVSSVQARYQLKLHLLRAASAKSTAPAPKLGISKQSSETLVPVVDPQEASNERMHLHS